MPARSFCRQSETLAARTSSSAPLTPGQHTVLAAFTKDGEDPPGVAHGTLQLSVDGTAVGSGTLKTQPGKFALAGEGLAVGKDSGDPVSKQYTAGFALSGVAVDHVTVTVTGEHYIDEEREAHAMLVRE